MSEEQIKNRNILILSIIGIVSLLIPAGAFASLFVDGVVEVNGQQAQLVYDDGRNLTWLDYSFTETNWMSAHSWAESLSINVNGQMLNDWRLPDTVRENNSYTYGYNITSSDLGHLFYEELGNQSPIGNNEWGLVNTGVFQNLLNAGYWSSTVVDDQVGDEHYRFDFSLGHQAAWSNGFWANSIAVRSGRIDPPTNPVNSVPEPGTALLFLAGLAGLVGVHLYKKQTGRYGVIFSIKLLDKEVAA